MVCWCCSTILLGCFLLTTTIFDVYSDAFGVEVGLLRKTTLSRSCSATTRTLGPFVVGRASFARRAESRRVAVRAVEDSRETTIRNVGDDETRLTVDRVEEDDDDDELVSALTERIEQAEGLWYSDDFYGTQGREWVRVSTTLVGASTGTPSLVAVKVTGDPNVPAGCVTWRTRGWPDAGGADVPTEVQVRADPNDPNGFSWMPASLSRTSEKRIVLSLRWNSLFESKGTFVKEEANGNEDEESS